jgi:alpha-galactosidase
VDRDTTKKLADLKAELGTRLITVMIGYGWSDLEGMSDLFVRTGDLVGDAESLVEQITANIVRADMA